MQLHHHRHDLIFKRPAGTSRGVLLSKPTWFISLGDGSISGEVSLIPGLSIDDESMIDGQLQRLQKLFASLAPSDLPLLGRGDIAEQLTPISNFLQKCDLEPTLFPGLRFALEMALINHARGVDRLWFASPFVEDEKSLPINGLIWMGERDFMTQQIERKLAEGYRCLKLKIGAIDFAAECAILADIRGRFSPDTLEIRVDANGAFAPEEALARLDKLAQFSLHSIEQPIRQGNWQAMASLCRNSPLAIALDEELIGVPLHLQDELLECIAPDYIILKPSLLGGFAPADSWIRAATARGIGWWNTSALESNLGLDAIAQWTAMYDPDMPQGLGTGALYTNNIASTLRVEKGYLHRGNTT